IAGHDAAAGTRNRLDAAHDRAAEDEAAQQTERNGEREADIERALQALTEHAGGTYITADEEAHAASGIHELQRAHLSAAIVAGGEVDPHVVGLAPLRPAAHVAGERRAQAVDE